MRLLGKRSLAWVLRLITDVALIGWVSLLIIVLVIMARERFSEEGGGRQGSVFLELKLPPEIVEPTTPDITVHNFEANRLRIHYKTKEREDPLNLVITFGMVLIAWGVFGLILWNLRQILASLVANQPLTLANAGRIRTIGFLMLFGTAFSSLSHSVEYLNLEPLFSVIPHRGFFGLYFEHFDKAELFTALLILLLAEVFRLGYLHRLDSEEVV